MIELGRATEAYNDARDSEAEAAFVSVSRGIVYRPDAKEQLASLIPAHEKRLPNSPSLDYYRGELVTLHEKWAEAVALFKRGLSKAPDDAWKDSYRPRVVVAMYKAGLAVAAHDEFGGDAAVFEQLAQLAVFDKSAKVLGEIIAAQAKMHANNPRLDFYRGELAQISGKWADAAEFYRAAIARADERDKFNLKWRLIQEMHKAGRSMAAYDEFDGDESVFNQLFTQAESDKNVDLVEALISNHQKRHTDLEYLPFWRARAAALKQDWQRAVEILAQNAAKLDALPQYQWLARDLHVRALLKTGAIDEARKIANRDWEEDRNGWNLLLVAVTERNIPDVERWIKQYQDDGVDLEELFFDDEIAAALRSEAFKPLLEKHEGLKKALKEME
jgi:tetratricopeptide (TPR) repeat protein